MEVKEIIELMKAMSENGMTGFELEEGDWKLSMKREKKIVAAAQTPGRYAGPGTGFHDPDRGCDRYGAGLR